MADVLRIFISYRREDSRDHAQFLYWQLAERLPAKLFLDIESITPGSNFQDSLDLALGSCDVLLALIGRDWTGTTSSGPPRLQRADDFVRREISTALARGTTVIPVLLDGTDMPGAADLPSDLAALTYRQALSLSSETMLRDVARLSRELGALLNREGPRRVDHDGSSDIAKRVANQQILVRDRDEAEKANRLRQSGLELVLVLQEGHSSPVHAVAFHPDGRWVASGGSDRTVRVWETATGKVVFVLDGHTGSVSALAFSPDGKLLASGGGDRTVCVWDLRTGGLLRCIEGHTYETNSVVFSPDGKAILVAGGDIRVWDTATGGLMRTFDEGWFAAFSPDGSTIAAPAHDGILRIWNAQSVDSIRKLQIAPRNSGLPLFALFTADGREVLTACAGSPSVCFWDVVSGELRNTIETEFTSHGVRSAALSPDGKCLALSDGEARFQLWNVETSRVDYEAPENDTPLIDSIAFDRFSGLIVCANRHNAVTLMDRRGLLVRTFSGSSRASMAVGIAADRKTIVAFGGAQSSTIWDAQNKRPICEMQRSDLRIARFSADSKYVVLKNNGNMGADVVDIAGSKIAEVEVEESLVSNVAFTADSEMMASLYEVVTILRTRTGQRVRQIRSTESRVRSIAFDPADGRLATGCEDGVVRFWDPETGKKISQLRGPESEILTLDFNPLSRILATGNSAGSLTLWDLSSSSCLGSFGGPGDAVSCLRFSPDGRLIACRSHPGDEIKVWEAGNGRLIRSISKCDETEHFEFTVPDSELMLVRHTTRNGTEVRLVSPSTGKELSTLRAYGDNSWIIVQPDGRYASSASNPAEVGWRIGDSVFQCASLHGEFRMD